MTSYASLAHLQSVVCCRFGKSMRELVVNLHIHCHAPKDQRAALVMNSGTHAMDFLTFVEYCFVAVFKRATNLKKITIVAPAAIPLDGHETFICTWQHPMMQNQCQASTSSHDPDGDHYHDISQGLLRQIPELIIKWMRYAPSRLHEVEILGFTKTTRLGQLIRPADILVHLKGWPCHNNLTSLTLQLNLTVLRSGHNLLDGVAGLIGNTARLKHLKLSASPPTKVYREPSETWTQLLRTLGSDPPFQLDTLELDGFVTSTSITLNRVVRAHLKTLRRITLQRTNFHAPNFLRPLCASLAESDIEYFGVREFFLHKNSWLAGCTMQWIFRLDQVLEFQGAPELSKKDLSYRDWIEVEFEDNDYADWLIYDNEDGQIGAEEMKVLFKQIVAAIDCGSIKDF